ncbi:MAG: hypothetical protein A2100_02375 [Sideroxydans sp. GWF2_59_14]|nr:MAG: hypothetical protein A2100_02375 [Sideroxydans sp. GWF2_59_14]
MAYYTALRFVAFAVFAWAAVIAYQKRYSALPWVFGLTAFVFNPFMPIYLTKGLWIFCDIGAALILVFTSRFLTEGASSVETLKSVSIEPNVILDGSDYEHAILVGSVDEEYDWIKVNFPNAKRTTQEVRSGREGLYDVLEIEFQDGSVRKVYFDITLILAKYVAEKNNSASQHPNN